MDERRHSDQREHKCQTATIVMARWRDENEASDVLSHHEQRKNTDAVHGKVRLQQRYNCKEVDGVDTNLHLSAFVEAIETLIARWH